MSLSIDRTFCAAVQHPFPAAAGTKERHEMNIRVALVGLVSSLVVLSACRVSAEIVRWRVDGQTREAMVYAPTVSREGERVPLVFSFHGYGDTMQNFQYTSLHIAWPEAIVVYGQGLERRGGFPGWQVEAGGDDRDLKFVDVVLASLRETYDIDEDRIYATGFSNGGMFTYLLWAQRSDVFAAYAPVAARLRPSVQPEQAQPVFHIAGERDRVVRFSDQQAAIDIALEVNAVAGRATESCGEGCTVYGSYLVTPVMTWIHPGAHTYPRETAGRLVSFFRDHQREP